MSDIEIGPGKRARAAYSFDEIAIVPSRRTRDPEEVSISWQIDAYKFDLPFMAAPMDSVVSPNTAIAIGKAGGLGVLNLEGIWTRHEDAEKQLAAMAKLSGDEAIKNIEQYLKPCDRRLYASHQPMHSDYSPELDIMPCLDDEGTYLPVALLSSYLAQPRHVHLEAVFYMYGYLKTHAGSNMVFDDKYIHWNDDDFSVYDWSDFYQKTQYDTPANALPP